MSPITFTPKCLSIFFVLSLGLFYHSYATPPGQNSKIFSLTNGLTYTDIDFKLINDLIIIPVKINGETELNFIVDTGTSSPIILHKRYVKHLNLPKGRSINLQGAGGGKAVQGSVIPSLNIQIAHAYAKRLGAVVLDNNPLGHLKIKGVTIHGIIGASLFRSFAVEIDYLTHSIRLHDGEGFLETHSYSSHPMEVVMSRPIVQTQVRWDNAYHSLKLMIDTGFNHHLLIYDNAPIQESMPKIETIGVGYSGNIKGSSASVSLLQLGERKLFDVHTYFPSFQAYKADQATTSYRDGIIGNALLKQYCVVFDYAHLKFYIREHLRIKPALAQDEATPDGTTQEEIN